MKRMACVLNSMRAKRQIFPMLISDAPTVWRLLNGIVCVYKPAGETCFRVRNSLLGKLSRELNELECRPGRKYQTINKDAKGIVTVETVENLADSPLVTGPKYEEIDFKCVWSTYLGKNTAGVLVLGLNDGTGQVYRLHRKHPMRVYRVTGTLGYLTEDLYRTGKVIERSSFKHVKLRTLESILAALQASHQRNMYELCGVDPESQAAYELAAKGLIRPERSNLPLVYSAKCVDFQPPHFTIELHCINEYEDYLKVLIQNIGQRLRTVATCTGLQCIRHSYFGLEQALLKKHWTLEWVIQNIASNRRIIKETGRIQSGLLQQTAQ